MIDGERSIENGEETYRERSEEEEMEKFKGLIKAVVGFNEDRGDILDVVNLKFQRPKMAEETTTSWFPELSESSVMRLLEFSLLGIFLLLTFIFGIKPSIAAFAKPTKDGDMQASASSALENQQTEQENEDDGQLAKSGNLKRWEKMPEDELRTIVNKLAKEQPGKAASIVRLWMKG